MSRFRLFASLFAASLLTFAVVACEDEGATCTSQDQDDCTATYYTCLEGLDHLSSSYPDELQACLDEFCVCWEEAGCDTGNVGCSG
ncbi:MAG: hypothetical protein M0R80_15135 [Proteobacteria bacterium]|nr:hypothetical protein [Pseudomonadota bacterium]